MYKFYSAVGLLNICKSSKVRSISVPKSRLVYSLLCYLKQKGYLHCYMDLGFSYRIILNPKPIRFRFVPFSKPSHKIYFTYKDILSYSRRGLFFIFSTSYGIVDSEFCLDKKIGGQPVLKFIYLFLLKMYFITTKKFFFIYWFNSSSKLNIMNFVGKLGINNYKFSFNYYVPYFFYIKNSFFKKEFYFLTFSKKFIGSFFTNISNLVEGVTSGYFRYLELKGVGFKVLYSQATHSLFFFLGYNHIVSYKLSYSIQVKIRKQYILLFSYNKSLLSYVSYQIKSLRFPDVYRGKGILFKEEILKLKPGKQR